MDSKRRNKSRSPTKFLQNTGEKVLDSLSFVQGTLAQQSNNQKRRNQDMNVKIVKGA